MARRMVMESGSELTFSDRTLYRHRLSILKRLNVVSWGPEARALAQTTIRRVAQARTDPADIINAAIDALIRQGFELPAIVALRRLAGTVHRNVNATQWSDVCGHLDPAQQAVLQALLVAVLPEIYTGTQILRNPEERFDLILGGKKVFSQKMEERFE